MMVDSYNNIFKRIMKFLNESKVLKNWGSLIAESTGINDPAKVLWISQMCEIQSQNAALNESNLGYTHLNPAMNINGMGAMQFPQIGATAANAGIAGDGSGDIPTQTLSIAIQIAAQTIALDLVPVVPMNAPFGVINYWDTVYGGGRVEGDGKFSQSGNSTAPLLVKLVGGDNYEDLYGQVTASDFDATEGIQVGTSDYTLYFVKLGFIDGKPIFVVKGGNAESDSDIENEFYPTAFGGLSLAEAGKNAGYQFGLVNTKEDHVSLFSGAGQFTSPETTTNPYDNAWSLNPYEREEGENTPLNVLNAKFTSKDVKVKTYQAAYALTWEQVQDAGKTGVGDIVALAEAALINELTQSINKLILSQMWELGAQFAKANGIADLDVTVDATNELQGGETKAIKARQILARILFASNLIAQKGRRGSASFVVCSPEVATAIQTVTTAGAWVAANTIDTKGDLYPIGSIAGMTVYVDPNLNSGSGTVIVGRKNKADEPGLVFCPYLMADKVEVVPESTMGYKVGMKSRFALISMGKHPETNYAKFNVTGALTLI